MDELMITFLASHSLKSAQILLKTIWLLNPQSRVRNQSFFWLLISLSSIANPKIEGTHNPMKIPASFSPLNQRISENIKERKADTSISKSAGVNFFSILSFLFPLNIHYFIQLST